MKRSAHLLILMSVVSCCLFSSCLKDSVVSVLPTCVDEAIARAGMVLYVGQSLDCKLYLGMFRLDGIQYFSVDNRCADMISDIIDCDGNVFCYANQIDGCSSFYSSAEFAGVVGVKE